MGLDIVGLVMEIEESFNIVLHDRDLERTNDLGDLYRLVLRQLGRLRNGPCLSGATFYRIRRALLEATGVSRREINPRTLLEELLPIESRRWQWQQLRESLGSIPVPKLRRPGWLIAMIAGLVLVFLGLAAGMIHGVAGVAVWGILIVAAIWVRLMFETALLTQAVLRLTAPLAIYFPHNYVTVRDVVRDVLKCNYGHIADALNPDAVDWADDDGTVWETICGLVSRWAGVDRQRLTETTRFDSVF